MSADPLLKELRATTRRRITARLADVFGQHLENDEETQAEQLKSELEKLLQERIDEALGS